MNKELIKKYKSEFDHWLNGGKLLGRFNFTNIKNYKPEPWFEFEEIKWSLTSFEYLNIIMEDEYVEFRKALAEGKTVEVLTDTLNINKTYWEATLEVESYLRKKGAYQYYKFSNDPTINRKNYLFYVDCGGEYSEGFINGCSISKEDNLFKEYTYKTLDDIYTWVKTNAVDTSVPVEYYRIKPEETSIKIGDYLHDIQYDKYYRIKNILDEKVETETFRVYKSSINGYDYRIWKPKIGELVVMQSEDYSTGFTVTPWEENANFSPVPFIGELPK